MQGFIEPRHRDGAWLKDFTTLLSGTWGGDTFYEGNSWTYSLFVPQDIAGLIRQSGGPAAFVRRLDAFFNGKGRFDVGNEPGFLSPYLYIWAGRQDRTSERVQQIASSRFHAGRKGLPGNDDSGAMSSWYVFAALGIFPNAGQDVYLIGHPTFPQATLHLAAGRTFVIQANNLSARKCVHRGRGPEWATAGPRVAPPCGNHAGGPAGTHHGREAIFVAPGRCPALPCSTTIKDRRNDSIQVRSTQPEKRSDYRSVTTTLQSDGSPQMVTVADGIRT